MARKMRLIVPGILVVAAILTFTGLALFHDRRKDPDQENGRQAIIKPIPYSPSGMFESNEEINWEEPLLSGTLEADMSAAA
jgi:hypothetical protein